MPRSSREIGLTADTARRAEGLIEISPLEEAALHGVLEPVALFSLHRVKSAAPAMGARSARDLTQFVGRDVEIAHLAEMLKRATGGSGQVTAIVVNRE